MRTRIVALLAFCCATGACGFGGASEARPAPVTRVERQEAASLPGIRTVRPSPVLSRPILFTPNRTPPGPQPLILVDGRRLSHEALGALNPNDIVKVKMHKGSVAVSKYGPAAVHGVVVITTRAAAAW